jgi:hypothetical protein
MSIACCDGSPSTSPKRANLPLQGRIPMLDLIYVAGVLAFFAATVAYAYACDWL